MQTKSICMTNECQGEGKFQFSTDKYLCESCLARLWEKVGSYFTHGGGLKCA